MLEYRVALKSYIGTSTYFLIYGKEAILPPNVLPSLQLSQQPCGKKYLAIQRIIDILVKLEEERGKEKTKFVVHQHIIKKLFDKNSFREEYFQIGDWF